MTRGGGGGVSAKDTLVVLQMLGVAREPAEGKAKSPLLPSCRPSSPSNPALPYPVGCMDPLEQTEVGHKKGVCSKLEVRGIQSKEEIKPR